MQLKPLVDAGPGVVGGADPAQVFRGDEIAEPDGLLADSGGEGACEMQHGNRPCAAPAVERKQQVGLLIGRPISLDDKAMPGEFLFIDVDEQILKPGLDAGTSWLGPCGDVDQPQALGIGSHHHVLGAVEPQPEAASGNRCGVGRHGHVEQGVAFAEDAAPGVCGKENHGVPISRVVDARPRRLGSLGRGLDGKRRHRDLDRTIEGLREFRLDAAQAVWARLDVVVEGAVGVHEANLGTGQREWHVPCGTYHDQRQQVDPRDPEAEDGQSGTAGWHVNSRHDDFVQDASYSRRDVDSRHSRSRLSGSRLVIGRLSWGGLGADSRVTAMPAPRGASCAAAAASTESRSMIAG